MSDPATTTDATRDDPEALRRLAAGWAAAAGDRARAMLAELRPAGPGAGGGLAARSKSTATDPVTAVDTGVEEWIRDRVRAERPGDRVLGEEGASDAGDADPWRPRPGGDGRVTWIVDPVDGTVNLLYGLPFCAVSVAAERGGRVVAGAVHVLGTGETYDAALGGGAAVTLPTGERWPLGVSDRAELGLALVGTGFAYDAGVRAAQGAVVAALLPRVRDIRRLGAAAVDLCLVGRGSLDAYYERGLKPWDFAAGALVAAEAGAVVELPAGPAGTTVAAAPGVAEAFRAALADAAADRT